MEFALNMLDGVCFQTMQPTILLEATMLQCFAGRSSELCHESRHVRVASQSWIAILFQA